MWLLFVVLLPWVVSGGGGVWWCATVKNGSERLPIGCIPPPSEMN